jgi:hypothetical protein
VAVLIHAGNEPDAAKNQRNAGQRDCADQARYDQGRSGDTAADQSIAETVWDSYGMMPRC